MYVILKKKKKFPKFIPKAKSWQMLLYILSRKFNRAHFNFFTVWKTLIAIRFNHPKRQQTHIMQNPFYSATVFYE